MPIAAARRSQDASANRMTLLRLSPLAASPGVLRGGSGPPAVEFVTAFLSSNPRDVPPRLWSPRSATLSSFPLPGAVRTSPPFGGSVNSCGRAVSLQAMRAAIVPRRIQLC